MSLSETQKSELLKWLKPNVQKWSHAPVFFQAPLTSGSFNGGTFSTTAKTLINLNTTFGLPAGISAVYIYAAIKDTGSAANDCFLSLSPNALANNGVWIDCSGLANSSWERNQLIVPCDSNGNIYYQIGASGPNSMTVYLLVWGYWQ